MLCQETFLNYTPFFGKQMKDWQNLQGVAQSEALLNELKGNLFEYLVAQVLSVHFGLEGDFLRRFQAMGDGRAAHDLKSYQTWLRGADSDLYSRLPALAKEVGAHLVDVHEGILKGLPVKHISVLGKSGAVSGQESFKEADILLELEEGASVPISLKLCKTGAFVNTKSAGIRSFIEKYFSAFDDAPKMQAELNLFLDQSFNQMANDLYEWADIPNDDFEKEGPAKQFNPLWVENGYSELPGELPEDARQKLHQHYYRVIEKIFMIFQSFKEKDALLFARSLSPLVGMGLEEMVQVTCFHKEVKGKRYQLASLKIFSWDDFKEGVKQLELRELQSEVSSFEVGLGARRLQIRVKPMNKFTVSALKVNCSLKEE